MAVNEISCNLSSSLFPFATELWGRSIIMPGLDENYNKTVFSTVDPGFEKTVAQVMYMHNVMPAVEGYQSVGFDTVIPTNPSASPSGAFGSFAFGISGFGQSPISSFTYDKIFPIQAVSQNRFLFVPAGGLNFIYDGQVGTWRSVSPFPANAVANNVQVTTAFVQGQTYIYYSQYGCFIYDDVNKMLVEVTLIGLNKTDILGICAANGYMIAYDNVAVAWSSLVNPTDFVPSLITGAGGGSVNDAKGAIIAGLQLSGGFVIYCQKNAVGASYTGNSNFPFILAEIPGSGGITTIDKVSWHANMSTHVVMNSYGLQEISKNNSKAVYPEASDFLASKLFEDFDEDTLALTSEYLDAPLNNKVTIVESRFLVLSYGKVAGTYTHALVYDMTLKRWGKLKITHCACFEWNAPNQFGHITYGALAGTTYGQLLGTTYGQLNVATNPEVLPKKNMAFLQADGTVKLINFDFSEAVADGVFIIGKFQLRRRAFVQHQYGMVETVNTGNAFDYYIMTSDDGKTLKPAVKAKLITRAAKTRMYARRKSGQSFAVMFIGQFNLQSYVVGFTMLGNK